jgi:ketosteroid isomerase-like protein
VRAVYAGWAEGEVERTLARFISPAVEVRPDPRAAWPGIELAYRGFDGVRSYLAAINEAFVGYRAEAEELLDAGDRVLALTIERGRGRYSDAFAEIRSTAHIWTLRDGLATLVEVNWDRDEARRAVGLKP